jgi:hypothetical protein
MEGLKLSIGRDSGGHPGQPPAGHAGRMAKDRAVW